MQNTALSLPSSTTQVELEGKTVYIVGTAHVSAQSVQDVRDTVAVVQPDTIAIELCEPRYQGMKKKTAWRETNLFQVVKQGKATFLLAQLAMQSFYRRLGQQLEVEPGAEMMAGVACAEETGARLVCVEEYPNGESLGEFMGKIPSKEEALALLARFSLAVDHRYISIAQIPGEMSDENNAPPPPARLISTKLSLSLDQQAVDATVTLALGEKVVEATEHGEKFGMDRQRAVARATVSAINRFLGQNERLHLADLTECFLSGKRVSIAAILYEEGPRREDLVGAAYDRGNGDDAVIHAVLDAVNRKLRL